MDKLGLIPILSIIIIASLSLGIFADIQGVFQNQDSPMTISNVNLKTEKNSFLNNGELILSADAIFNEDLDSISINGTLYNSDGTYKEVIFQGSPENGVKNQMYQLNYSSWAVSSDYLDNMNYLELTIKTTNKEGQSKEMKINITSTGQVDTNSSNNNTSDYGCQICGKPTDDYGVHLDGTFHTDAEIDAWFEKNYPNAEDNDKKTIVERVVPSNQKIPDLDQEKLFDNDKLTDNSQPNNREVNVVTRGDKSS